MTMLRVPALLASAALVFALAACSDPDESGGETTQAQEAPSATPTATSSAPAAEPTLEQQVAPYCPDLVAALKQIPDLNPTSEQVAVLKKALEGGVRANTTGAAKTEVESWYTTTTDLAVAAFGGGDDFTKKWAEWTMGTKIAIQDVCNA